MMGCSWYVSMASGIGAGEGRVVQLVRLAGVEVCACMEAAGPRDGAASCMGLGLHEAWVRRGRHADHGPCDAPVSLAL